MNSNPQLPLGLSLRDGARFNSFFPGRNLEALNALQAVASGSGESLLYLVGSTGLGKTHLLQAACVGATDSKRSSAYLPLREFCEFTPAVFDDLEQLDLLCVDDVSVIAGRDEWEQGLFNLFNRVRQSHCALLLAGDDRPDQSGIVLPDLVSRLGWGVTYLLKPLDDENELAALTFCAEVHGLDLPEETAQYLLKRYPRNLPAFSALFDTLNTASLVEQRRLTVPFVCSVLDD